MDMDTSNSPKPPELEIEPAGEANTTVSTTQPTNDAVEPLQTEVTQPPTEPVPTPETPQTEPLSEPIAETPTAQMGRNEPLPESAPEAETPSATLETGSMDSGSEAGMTMPAVETPITEATAEAPEIETPTPSPTPSPDVSLSEETPPKAEESPQTPTQQGIAQPEPQPTPASPPESLPAPAPTIAIPPQNIVGLILTKARLIIQLRKQKKLNKVMGLFLTKSKITNDEVEKLLHVSDATATRYLSELEKQGKIIQSGKTGHAVTYTKR
jgi:hypothetical protein